MRNWLPIGLVLIIVVGCLVWLPVGQVRADELAKTTKALEQKQEDLQKAKRALEQAEELAASLSGGLDKLKAEAKVAAATAEERQAEAEAALADFERQEALLWQKREVLMNGMRGLYKDMLVQRSTQLVNWLDSGSLLQLARMADYQERVMSDEHARMVDLVGQVKDLEERKSGLKEKAELAKAERDEAKSRLTRLEWQIANAHSLGASSRGQIANLNKQIKGLTAEQQRLASQKTAANEQKVIAGGETSEPLPKDPGFSGKAFALVSYGYYHRVGMNQWGARGRALAGQSYKQILNAYFQQVNIGKSTSLEEIEVEGYGRIPFEDNYMRGISEMSRSWGALGGGRGMEALKAQAVVARTYAVGWVKDGNGAICTTERCQVYRGNLVNDTNSGGWDYQYNQMWYQAVKETEGVIITQKGNGQPINAWFSSTAGGYTQRSDQVWGGVRSWTRVTADFAGSWPGGAYDKESPWFYKAWGSRGSGFNPWITEAEMADMVNAAVLLQKTGQTKVAGDFDILRQDFGGSSPAELRKALERRGMTAAVSVSSVKSVLIPGVGQSQLTVKTNGGTFVISGPDMQRVINARAPGTIELTSTLFNVESQ